MDSYPVSVAYAASNHIVSTQLPQDCSLVSDEGVSDGFGGNNDLTADDMYKSQMPDHAQSQGRDAQVEDSYRTDTGGDLQFTYFSEEQVPHHSSHEEAFTAVESTYQLVSESEPAYNIQLTSGYFLEPETVHGLPPAEMFSSGTYSHLNAPVNANTSTIRLSPSLSQDNFIQSSEYDHTNVPYLIGSTSARESVTYPGEIYESVDLDTVHVSESYNAVTSSQSWQYAHQLQHTPDVNPQPFYHPEESYIFHNYSDSTTQLGCNYSSSIQPFKIAGNGTTSVPDSADPYNQIAYEAFEPAYVIGPAHPESVTVDKLADSNFPTTKIVYQVESTAEDTSYVNYPVAYEQNSQIYPNVYPEFGSSVPVGTELRNQGHYYCKNVPVCSAVENAPTYASYTMVSDFDERTVVPPLNSLVWIDPNGEASTTATVTSTIPGQLNLSTSMSWTERKSNGSLQSEAYGFIGTNGQLRGDPNTAQLEENQYTIHRLQDYTSGRPNTLNADAISHQSLFSQSQPYVSYSTELVPIATSTTAAQLQPHTSFLPNREQTIENDRSPPASALRCIHCAREFSRPSHLEIHLRVHTGAQPYSCILCGRQFNQASNLRRHLSSHKTWPPIIPNNPCSVSNPDRPNPLRPENQTERENSTTKSKQWICAFCGEQVASYRRLRGHMIRHKDRRVYACVFETCSATFTLPESFLAHVTEEHPDPLYTEASTCTTCGRQFRDATSNIQHWLPRRRGLPFRCGVRSLEPPRRSRFGSSNYLPYRRRRQHSTAAAIICHARSISRRHSQKRLNSHPAAQTESRASSGAVKTQIRLLTLQRPQLTQLNQLYRCPLCPRNCRALNRLRQHLSSSHSETLALAVKQNTDVSVLHPETPHCPSLPTTDDPVRTEAQHVPNSACQILQSEKSRTSVVKPALFLLHVEESRTSAEKRGQMTNRLQADSMGKSSMSSTMCCEYCGRAFQKLKFFNEHQLMCKQKIEEQQRRKRLRLRRKMHFRESMPSEYATQDDATLKARQTTDSENTSERPSLGSCQTDDGLRRSQRSKTFQVLWVPRKPRRRTNDNSSLNNLASFSKTQTSSSPTRD